jgi:beta-lactamase superfamily II metal-dependent hydrolase
VTAIAGPSLTVLDVGHGSCAVLLETGRTVVFDAGPKSGLLEYLRETGITTLDLMLISHADQDHIRGVLAILGTDSIKIKAIRLNTDSGKESGIWDDLLWELDQLQQTGKTNFPLGLTQADNGQFDSSEVKIEILAPSAYLAGKGPKSKDRSGRRIRSNSISTVIKLYYHGDPVVLLTGDLDDIGLDDLIRTGRSLEAPILIFPHHGGHSGAPDMGAFAAKLFDQVKPKQVLFSIGRGLHGTPIPAVVAAAKKNIAGVRISCTQLSEHCSATVPKSDHTHISGVFARGRDARSCCAGSITIHLEVRATTFPIWDDHQNFITSSAPTALCRL